MNITEIDELNRMKTDMEELRDELTTMWELAKRDGYDKLRPRLMKMACKAGKAAGEARRLADGDTAAPLFNIRHIPILGTVR